MKKVRLFFGEIIEIQEAKNKDIKDINLKNLISQEYEKIYGKTLRIHRMNIVNNENKEEKEDEIFSDIDYFVIMDSYKKNFRKYVKNKVEFSFTSLEEILDAIDMYKGEEREEKEEKEDEEINELTVSLNMKTKINESYLDEFLYIISQSYPINSMNMYCNSNCNSSSFKELCLSSKTSNIYKNIKKLSVNFKITFDDIEKLLDFTSLDTLEITIFQSLDKRFLIALSQTSINTCIFLNYFQSYISYKYDFESNDILEGIWLREFEFSSKKLTLKRYKLENFGFLF